MSALRSKDQIYIKHILKNIAAIQRLTFAGKADFLADEDTQAAILYYLQTMAESTVNLTDEIKTKYDNIDWKQIRSFRNVVVHAYLSIDLDIVWKTIEVDLPLLKIVAEQIDQHLEKKSD